MLWSARDWLAAHTLCNRMMHEYQPTADDLIQALHGARELIPHFIETYNTINQRLADTLDIRGEWPEKLDN